MRFPQPSVRRLLLSWGLLVGLTGASLAAALVGGDGSTARSLDGLPLGITMATTALKAREILSVFLNLGGAPPGWRGLFFAFIAVILAGVVVAHGVPIVLATTPAA